MSPARPILLAAGGTGGHLFPAEALAAALAKRGAEVELATDSSGNVLASNTASNVAAFVNANPLASTLVHAYALGDDAIRLPFERQVVLDRREHRAYFVGQ